MKPRRIWIGLVATAVVLGSAACSSTKKPAEPGAGARSPTSSTRVSTSAPAAAPVALQAVQEAWTLPAGVSRTVVLPNGTGFIVLGGLSPGDVSTSRVVSVDPGARRAEEVGRLALAVHDSAGAAIGGRWFLFGGGSSSTVSAIQAWTGSSATEVGRLPVARSDLSTATAGGTTYVVGGFDGTSMTTDVLATTDGVSFRTVGHLAVGVRYAAVAATSSAIWVVGGVTSTSEGGATETDAIQKVDLASGQTSIVARLSQPLGHATAVVVGGQVFVLGGRSGSTPSSSIWRLDPTSGVPLPAGRLPQAVSDAGSVVVGGVAYLVGGEVSGPTAPLDTVVALRPSSGG